VFCERLDSVIRGRADVTALAAANGLLELVAACAAAP
jgi:hypothetical protein